ncbi:MAG: ABC transporter ATP-binding protein [Planctomycetota bacterium]
MLALQGVRKRFGDVVAVDGVTLTIERGEVFGMLGPNGAGKTTTIAMATGLISPDEGTVTVGDAGPPTTHAARAHIGLSPQSIALYDRLTARENLVFFGGIAGLSRGAARAKADELLETVGLQDRASGRVTTFSGGMQRRLNIAATLMHNPTIILLDEPTVGVDPHSRTAIFDLVERFRDENRCVVYTTHYMEEAQRLCDRVAIIDHGRVRALGSVDGLIASHGGDSVVTVERPRGAERIETAAPVETLASLGDLRADTETSGEGSDRVLSVKIDPPDLERVFLNLTGRTLRDG